MANLEKRIEKLEEKAAPEPTFMVVYCAGENDERGKYYIKKVQTWPDVVNGDFEFLSEEEYQKIKETHTVFLVEFGLR